MDELRDQLKLVDGLPAPDLWPEALIRAGVRAGAAAAASARRPERHRGGDRGWRKIVTIAASFAVFAAAASFVWVALTLSGPAPQDDTTLTPPSATIFDLASVPEGWTELPYAPPEARGNAATAWTGEELLVFGGYVYSGYSDEEMAGDGFRFDPATGATSPMAEAPISARGGAASAWTGTELLVWGGTDGTYRGNSPGLLGDGAAYDPSTDTWRLLPRAPISPRVPLSVWTGRELIVWGTSTRVDERPRDGAAYDPVSDAWRPIAEGPIELTDATAVWTDEEMVVFGAALHGGNFPETPTAIGAAYDPGEDRWRALPASDMSPNANHAAWTGEELVVWDYGSTAQVYDPSAGSWRRLPRVPVDDCEGVPSGIGGSEILFGQFCGEYVVLRDETWHNVTRPELRFAANVSFFVGDVIVSYGYSWQDFGPGEQVRAFAYRPPRSFGCGGFGLIQGAELARAVAERLALLRSDRPEADVREELDQLLSSGGATSFAEDGPLAGNNYPVETVAVDVIEDGAWRVVMRMGMFAGGEFGQQLILRPGTNLAGEECPLVVDGAGGFDLATRFVPDSTRVGDRFASALTFPDGSRVEVSFPEGPLRVLYEGVSPQVSYLWLDDPSPRFAISFLHGSRESALLLLEPEGDERVPAAGGGSAELAAGAGGTAWWLVYELPDWVVSVPLESRDDAANVAAAIAVTQDELGFPVVHASGPLALSIESGEGGGPVLGFSDAQSSNGRADLWIEPCTPGPPELDEDSGLACLAEGRLTLSVSGSRRFAADMLDGFVVESFTPAA
ncbi:MAG: hypothetical protein WD096_09815 [Actinomycetota bacterium]